LSPAWNRSDAVVITTVVACAAALRFIALGHQGLWNDEAVTALLLHKTTGQMLADIPASESTPPLYYLLAKGWASVFGHSEAGLRSFSALVGVGAVPVVFLAARRLAGRRVGLVAAVLVAVNPLLIWYSQEARAYCLMVFEAGVCLWFFARARERPTVGRLLAWSVAGSVSLCTHYFALFVLAPQAVLLLAHRRPALHLRVLSLAPLGLTGLALLTLAQTQSARRYVFTIIPLPVRVAQVPHQFLLGFSPPADVLVILVGAGAVVTAAAILARRADSEERRAAWVTAAIGGTACAVPAVMAAIATDYFNTRNIIAALPALLICLAAGLGGRRAGLPGLVATAALAVVSIIVVFGVQRDIGAQRGHFREVASHLRSLPGKRRAVLLEGSRSWATSLRYYLPGTRWVQPRGAAVREIDVIRMLRRPTPCVGRDWWGATCGFDVQPPLAKPPARGFRFVSVHAVAGFAVTRYRAARRTRIYQNPLWLDLRDRTDLRPGGVRVFGHVLLISP
jgi:uncharacterized membrane protein